jgi:hypothetical protein
VNTRRAAPALVAGVLVAGLVGAATVVAARPGSPVVPVDGTGLPGGTAGWFLAAAAAFVAYITGLALTVRRSPLSVGAVLGIGAAVQLIPLAGPLLLSTDAWTYWAYGWIAHSGDASPYEVAPSAFPQSPITGWVGADWVDTTTVYGPLFTLGSEGVAAAVSSPDAAAACFRVVAATAVVASSLLASRVSRSPALAAAFVGWNPLLAVHFAGGGHNDALVGALLVGALALGARGRARLESVAWATAIGVKWLPLVWLPLRWLERRAAGRPTGWPSFVAALATIAAVAGWRYGSSWLDAVGPLADNAVRATRFALPSRLEQAGVPEPAALSAAAVVFAAGYAILVHRSLRGRSSLGLGACLVLLTTPYLAVWYLGWAVPLAAADDDRLARLVVLGLCAYLLPQTIPV